MNSTLPVAHDADLALAAALELGQDFVFHLHVPRVIIFAGLQDRARGRHRVAAALDLQRIEIRPVRNVVVGIELAADGVARLEVDEQIRPGAHRLQVGRRVARLAADIVRKQVFRDDHAERADKGVGPERRRLREDHANGEVVDLLDLDILVAGDGDGCGFGRSRILPGEHNIVRRERHAVMPFDALLQLPDHREPVLGEAAVVLARNLGSQHRNQIAFVVPSRQRLVKDPGALLVLGADGKMRVEQGYRLPIQKFKGPAAAGLGRLVRDRGRSHRHPGMAEHHAGDRRRQADGDQPLHKGPPRQSAGRNICNQVSKVPLVHRFGSLLMLDG